MKKVALVALAVMMAASMQPLRAAGGAAQDAQNGAAASANSAAPSGSTIVSLAPTPASEANMDPAKEADIHRLLELTGVVDVAKQVMSNMEQNIKPLMTNSLPPGDYREKLVDLFFQKFQSKMDTNHMLSLAVSRYDENFSDDEIKQLIVFYQTPLGQKVVTVLPKMTQELQQDGEKMGQQLGRESMLEVLQEHPDLAQGLREAAQKPAIQAGP